MIVKVVERCDVEHFLKTGYVGVRIGDNGGRQTSIALASGPLS